MAQFNLSKPLKLSLILVGLVIVCITYSNHFNNPFEFDDEHTISTNEYIRNIHNIPRFFKDATTTSSLPLSQAYRPGLTTLNAIDYYIGGKTEPDPFYFHVSIFISFILLGLILFKVSEYIFKRTFDKTTSFIFSSFLITWFWVHTANSQTVNYIIARADSFSTLMVLVALWMYLYSPFIRKYYLYMVPVIAGFLVKEPTIMFVPILFVYKWLFEKNNDLKRIKFASILTVFKEVLIPFGIIAGLYLFSRQMTPKHWSSGNTDVLSYLFSQPFVILHYFNNFILPVNIVIDTDWDFVHSFTEDRVIIGLAFLAVMLITIIKTSVNHKPVAFGLTWFLLALLPTSSVFPLAEVLNDHRPFFGYIGLFIAATYILILAYQKSVKKYGQRARNIFFISLPALLLVNAVATYKQNNIWGSSEGVWKDATIKAPKNARAWMNYGNALTARADYVNAEKAYNVTAQLWPYYPYVYINLAVLYDVTKHDEKAEELFKKAMRLDSLNPEVYSCYGKFLKERNRMDESLFYIDKGLSLSPKHANLNMRKKELEFYFNHKGNSKEEALKIALQNVAKEPTAENYLQLSFEYYNLGQFDECIKKAEKALEIKPDYALPYNNICSAYNQLQQWDKAIEAGEKGLKLDPNNQLLKGNLDFAINSKKNKK